MESPSSPYQFARLFPRGPVYVAALTDTTDLLSHRSSNWSCSPQRLHSTPLKLSMVTSSVQNPSTILIKITFQIYFVGQFSSYLILVIPTILLKHKKNVSDLATTYCHIDKRILFKSVRQRKSFIHYLWLTYHMKIFSKIKTFCSAFPILSIILIDICTVQLRSLFVN